MSRLEHDLTPPHRVIAESEVARAGRHALHRDEVEWPNGDRGPYTWIETTSSSFIVPLLADGSTVLVRQWRYPWRRTSWEVPAGTLEDGEDPLHGARRELAEEAGLASDQWEPLGVTCGSALLSNRQHLFLARNCREVPRRPETYERDMIVRRLPLSEAVEEALGGGIEHATAIAALLRAAHRLGGSAG